MLRVERICLSGFHVLSLEFARQNSRMMEHSFFQQGGASRLPT